MKKRTVLFLTIRFFLFLILSVSATASSWNYSEELNRKAVEKKLYENPYWLHLLYYKKSIFGRWNSEVANRDFFVSSAGRYSPELELKNSLRALNYEGEPDNSPECLFPERYAWLRDELQISTETFPVPECRSFKEWKSVLNTGAISLIFAGGYLNNPSTLYGHTFLRLHNKTQKESDLMDYTVNYSADAPGRDLLFPIKGLTGFYPGSFTTLPYYMKIQEYHNMDNRDVWEFPLEFKQEEIDRFLRHAWELGKAEFPYYFLDRNCSWQLIPLLEIAKKDFTVKSSCLWVIPSDTVKALYSGTPDKIIWRPSLVKIMEWKRAALSKEEKQAVFDLSLDGKTKETLKKIDLMPQRRAAMTLETASDYLSWKFYSGKITKNEFDAKVDPVLFKRAEMGAVNTFEGGPRQPDSVIDGHDSMKISASLIGTRRGPQYELAFRPALQDLLDDSAGYLPDSKLTMGDFRLRYEKNYGRFFFKKADIADILSLNEWDRWEKAKSWKLGFGFKEAPEQGRIPGKNQVWDMRFGAGISGRYPVDRDILFYLLASADNSYGGILAKNWRLGAGPEAGVLAGKENFKLHAGISYLSYFLGDGTPAWNTFIETAWILSRNQSLRLGYLREGKNKELSISFQLFFFPF